MPTKRIIVSWVIPIFDRRNSDPLPFARKHCFLDWDLVPDMERGELLALLDANGRQNSGPQPNGAETIITMSCTPRSGSDPRLIRFRQYFVERRLDDVDRDMHAPGADIISFQTISFMPEYIEDEAGNRLTEHDVFDHVVGPQSLILDNPESLLRIGPVPAKELDAWQQWHSDLLQQFLRVVARIHASDWAKSPSSISYCKDKDGGGGIIHRVFPSHTEVEAVLTWFRQLYASDDLFVRACNLYLRHVDHAGKHFWVSRVRARFTELRTSKPCLTPVDDYTRAELIDLIAYGCRVLHRQSERDAEMRLENLVAKHGAAEVAMAVNASLWDLLGQATLLYHPIEQDFAHWVATAVVPPARSLDLKDIMESDNSGSA